MIELLCAVALAASVLTVALVMRSDVDAYYGPREAAKRLAMAAGCQIFSFALVILICRLVGLCTGWNLFP